MAKPKLKLVTEADADAIEIGNLYKRGKNSVVETVLDWWQCGKRLLTKKSLSEMSANWSAWIAANEDALGFSQNKAGRLMQLYSENSALTQNINYEIAERLLCNLWGNKSRHDNLKGQYEWYTPLEIIEAAREVMGGIDLDPASCEHANKIVKAAKYYTEEDDGLKKEWEGRIFINPPFAHPAVKYFAHKLMESLGGGVDQAVWLSNACVDVVWWHQLAEIGIVCFHKGRIKFYGEDGDLQPPTLGQSIFYFGDNRDKFREVFSKFGVVLS